MGMPKIRRTLAVMLLGMVAVSGAADAGPLILKDIGPYRLVRDERPAAGEKTAARLPEQVDRVVTATYRDGDGRASITVQIMRYIGGSADQWLLHVVDRDFRSFFGIPHEGYRIEEIDGKRVLVFTGEHREFRWVSGTRIIRVVYGSGFPTIREPLEILRAYLAKYPSAVRRTKQDLIGVDGKMAWIKVEMERRLWQARKRLAEIKPADRMLRDKLATVNEDLVVFLKFREQYSGILAMNERVAVENALRRNDLAAVRAKAREYADWWKAHKDDVIVLP